MAAVRLLRCKGIAYPPIEAFKSCRALSQSCYGALLMRSSYGLNPAATNQLKVNRQFLRIASSSNDKNNASVIHAANRDNGLRIHSHVNTNHATTADQLLPIYLQISKIRLTGLVLITSIGGYLLAPGDTVISSLLLTSLGVGLSASSANAINQWLEVPYDSQMARTRNRVLVKGLITPVHAMTFAAVTGASSVALLYFATNPLTASLAAFNIFLYTCMYTPSKRLGIGNTWLGSVVGALPPLMGWAAKTGGIDIGALVLAGILYSWQFPHFNALSWNLKADYSRAGYRMMAVTHPELCRKVSLRHTVALTIFSCLLPICQLTPWWFALCALPTNAWFTWLAWRFYKDANNQSARKLFRFSLYYLPLIIGTMFISKLVHKDQSTEQEQNDEN